MSNLCTLFQNIILTLYCKPHIKYTLSSHSRISRHCHNSFTITLTLQYPIPPQQITTNDNNHR